MGSTDEGERRLAKQIFRDEVFAVLTPLAVDPGHPFPFISNLSTSLGVELRSPDGGDRLFARVKVPQVLPQWIRLETREQQGAYRYVSLLDLIRHNLHDLFPGMVVEDVLPFRITRNADVESDEVEEDDDLMEIIEEELRQRRRERTVRLELPPAPNPWMRQLLVTAPQATGRRRLRITVPVRLHNAADDCDLADSPAAIPTVESGRAAIAGGR